ncbi:hypothetical protein, partial [Bradyrhizobium uaiense]|uniref:hypothetical protein n=1 Tax=Bradyrhizobium uaiense TaxID=2594946 RepID=UPI0019D5B558
ISDADNAIDRRIFASRGSMQEKCGAVAKNGKIYWTTDFRFGSRASPSAIDGGLSISAIPR